MSWDQDDGYSVEGEQAAAPHKAWPEGNYEGKYVRHQCAPSATKGTPGISIWFDVQGREVEVKCWISEASLSGFTGSQLEAIGWNGSYANCEFDPPETVALWMKTEKTPGKYFGQERWNISAVAKAAPGAEAAAERAAQLWKARLAKPAATPTARPTAPKPPASAAPKPTPPAPGKTAPAKSTGAPKKPKPSAEAENAERLRLIAAVTDSDSAWAVWEHAKCTDGDAFWRRAAEIAGSEETDSMTPEQWQEVASAVPPF